MLVYGSKKMEKQFEKLKEELGITGYHSNYSNDIKAIALFNISKEFKRFNDLFEKFLDKS